MELYRAVQACRIFTIFTNRAKNFTQQDLPVMQGDYEPAFDMQLCLNLIRNLLI